MKVVKTRIPGVLLFEPKVFEDERGSFLETWSEKRYEAAGVREPFVQDNLSLSRRGVLRGLHYQVEPHAQGKLVGVHQGSVFDVAVDLRGDSPTFGEWVGFTLTSVSRRQMYVPPGCAHGFVVTSDEALFYYKCTAYYAPFSERSLRWDDPDLQIQWPISEPLLSEKDARAPLLRDSPVTAIGSAENAAPLDSPANR